MSDRKKVYVLSIIFIISVFTSNCNGNGDFLSKFNIVNNYEKIVKSLSNIGHSPLEQLRSDNTNERYNEAKCYEQFAGLLLAVNNSEIWAIKVVDSWGKMPSGILSGNLYELGDFDECLSTKQLENFSAQYCLARISPTNLDEKNLVKLTKLKAIHIAHHALTNIQQPRNLPKLGLNIGVCAPDTCSPETLTKVLIQVTEQIGIKNVKLNIIENSCQTKNDNWDLSPGDIAAVSLLLITAGIMAISTIYDIIRTQQKKNRLKILVAFSIYSNCEKIFKCKRSNSPDVIGCLNGIRAISAMWVVYGHSYTMQFYSPSTNYFMIPALFTHYSFLVVLLAPLAVDSFLFMSGLLVTWSILKHFSKTGGKINIFLLYFHRILRLTPLLGAIILIRSTLLEKISSGPMWPIMNKPDVRCTEYWWATLLYIQNYHNPENMCLPHSWYLAVDMQLFIAAPFLLYLLYHYRHKIVIILVLLIFISMAWTTGAFVYFDFLVQYLNFAGSKIEEQMVFTYFPTHARMGTWLVGMILGYILFDLRDKRVKWSKSLITLCWITILTILAVIVSYTYLIQQMSYKTSPLESGLFVSFTRVTWSIALSLLTFACIKGYGGPVNWFLSLPHWQPIARLSYSIYLVHVLVIKIIVASTHRSTYLSEGGMVLRFFGQFCLSFLVCIVVTQAFESPIILLGNGLFGTLKHPQSHTRNELVQEVEANGANRSQDDLLPDANGAETNSSR